VPPTIYNAKVEAEAPVEEVDAVNRLFHEAGIDVEFQRDVYRFSSGVLPWIVTFGIATPLITFLSAFAKKTGELAAEDAWPILRDLVRNLLRARADNPNGYVELNEGEGDVDIVLPPSLSDEAYAALVSLDFTRAVGRIGWDPSEQAWFDLKGNRVPAGQ
jgi:hypothetical protein